MKSQNILSSLYNFNTHISFEKHSEAEKGDSCKFGANLDNTVSSEHPGLQYNTQSQKNNNKKVYFLNEVYHSLFFLKFPFICFYLFV